MRGTLARCCPACGSRDVVSGKLALDPQGVTKPRATAIQCVDCGERFVSLGVLLDLLVSAPIELEPAPEERDTVPPEPEP